LTNTIATWVRDLVRQICTKFDVEILKGHVSKDHVHLFVSCPPHVSPSALMQRVKGRSSHKLMAEYAEIRKACCGRVFFVASSGNVTDEVSILKSKTFLNRTIISRWITVSKLQSGFQPTSHEPAAFQADCRFQCLIVLILLSDKISQII
jgi:hypothetical protein